MHSGKHSEGARRTVDAGPSFTPQLAAEALSAFTSGHHFRAHRMLGSHPQVRDGISGTRFAVWAPNADRVNVVGNFNDWSAGRHPMTCLQRAGVWELFIPAVCDGDMYKYEIRNRDTGETMIKADPYARRFELRPATASIVTNASSFVWTDDPWVSGRGAWLHKPMSIYELHPGAWRRDEHGALPNYRALTRMLVPYLHEHGFTHVELMPVMEHPLDESWGYQCTGWFAPTRRFGEPDDFRFLVNELHAAGIGVILDWVPGHFPDDEHALARFDGSPLYEHADSRRAYTPDWGTLAFNHARNEVISFLVSSAACWLEEFHVDGLRVDAVASMLYRDYGRRNGEWVPNEYGGREDLEAVHFLQLLNTETHGQFPGTVTIAEESTSWPGVTRPVHLGGLGFSMKWNMGWMHDALEYFRHDPVHRRYHHDRLTFSGVYAWSENYVLALSHDEVVHGKGTLYDRMPGDDWQKHANLRLLFTYQLTWPGKKLLFMGNEFGAREEWAPGRALDWSLLEHERHRGILSLVRDLNMLYRDEPALHVLDFDASGFEWLDCHDAENSVLAWLRTDGEQIAIVVLNGTPVPRHGYHVGVPQPGHYREAFNSDAAEYGGTNIGNFGGVVADTHPWGAHGHSLSLTLPPLAGLVLILEMEK